MATCTAVSLFPILSKEYLFVTLFTIFSFKSCRLSLKYHPLWIILYNAVCWNFCLVLLRLSTFVSLGPIFNPFSDICILCKNFNSFASLCGLHMLLPYRGCHVRFPTIPFKYPCFSLQFFLQCGFSSKVRCGFLLQNHWREITFQARKKDIFHIMDQTHI